MIRNVFVIEKFKFVRNRTTLKKYIVCYRYTIGMFKKGYQKTLDVDDLYNPIKSDRSTVLGDRLERLVFRLNSSFFFFVVYAGYLNMFRNGIKYIGLPCQVFLLVLITKVNYV